MRKSLLTILAVMLIPTAALAQSSIAGQVTDNTGGVLPGVTVEASSPVLIEGSRIAVTDGAGRYTVVNLRPGTYTVTMTLPGFSTLAQEDINLPSNFTQTVNGQLAVGGVEETITVTGESPVVDVQNAGKNEVITREVFDALPTPRNVQGIAFFAQGVRMSRPDVGGTEAMTEVKMISHGANVGHQTYLVDGMNATSGMTDNKTNVHHNQALAAEISLGTSGAPAEVQAGGARVNLIPRDGGNAFSGSFFGSMSDGSWQANNLDSDLMGRGVDTVDALSNYYDFNPSIGGPIIRDKLWYFGGYRDLSVDALKLERFQANAWTPSELVGRQGVQAQYLKTAYLRLTAQASSNTKMSVSLDRHFKWRGRSLGSTGSENPPRREPVLAAGTRNPKNENYHVGQAKSTTTLTNRMLLEVGYSQVRQTVSNRNQPNVPVTYEIGAGRNLFPDQPSDLITCVVTPCYHPLSYDQTRPYFTDGVEHWDFIRREATNGFGRTDIISPAMRWTPMVALSYVTGSHNFRAGVQFGMGMSGRMVFENAGLRQEYRDGVPDRVRVGNSPSIFSTFARDTGIFVQDTWTRNRLTINAGVRIDSFRSQNNTWKAGGGATFGRFIPVRVFADDDIKPFWNDISPRLGVVYDLFGDARTAVKFSVSRFVLPHVHGFARPYHPITTRRENRDWFDCALNPAIHTDGAFGSTADCATAAHLTGAGLSPDYMLTNGDDIAQDHEIGLLGNGAVFNDSGTLPRAGRRPDPNIKRENNWEYTASIQHEVAPGISITAAYYRRVFYDLKVGTNVALTNCDFLNATAGVPCGSWMPFNVTFTDPLGLYPEAAGDTFLAFNLDPAQRTLRDTVDGSDTINTSNYNAFELSFNARLPNGGTAFGGWTGARNVQNTCGLQNPNGVNTTNFTDGELRLMQGGRWCDQGALGMPFRHDFKLFGVYPLPGDFFVSGGLQAYSGIEKEIRWNIPASLFPGGQRTSSTTVKLDQPGTSYAEYWTQVDVQLRKVFRIGRFEYSGQAEIYNLLNNNTVTRQNFNYGSSLFRPSRILQGRILRLALQAHW